MSSKLMNQYYGTHREKKRKFADLYIKLLWKMLSLAKIAVWRGPRTLCLASSSFGKVMFYQKELFLIQANF